MFIRACIGFAGIMVIAGFIYLPAIGQKADRQPPVIAEWDREVSDQGQRADQGSRRYYRRSAGTYRDVVASWPGLAQDVAQKMVSRYGPPDEATASMLTWHNNGPWKHTIVYRDPISHDFPKPHKDLLEQAIDYKASTGRLDDLAAYDGSVIVERTKGEISARCDKEEMNFLALNLAHDVSSGRRSVAAARAFYAKTAMEFMQGKRPAYTQDLLFKPADNRDLDKPALPKEPPMPPVTQIDTRYVAERLDYLDVVNTWPAVSQDVAHRMITRYGAPQEATPTQLVWHNNGPWKRTMLSRDPAPHRFPKPHVDLLEQFIDYRVPPDRFDEVAAYDGSVIVERTKGEMSARCDKEEMNFLALNLANDVIKGRRTVKGARAFYAEAAKAYMAGETRPYMQKLQFRVPKGGTKDADHPFAPE
jgi:hypothetical protein